MPRQRKDRADTGQQEIVKSLRKMGYSVITGMDDLIVGAHGLSLWYELKRPDARSKKDGRILDSFIKPSQKTLLETYKGHYRIVCSLQEILEDIADAIAKQA